jgi:hypothetical protein
LQIVIVIFYFWEAKLNGINAEEQEVNDSLEMLCEVFIFLFLVGEKKIHLTFFFPEFARFTKRNEFL